MTKSWKTVTDVGYELNTVIPGDCLEVLPGFPEGCVDLVVTSPPYNVGLDYGPGIDDRRPWDDYFAWLEEVLAAIYRVLKEGGVLAINVPSEVKLPKSQMGWYGKRVQKIGAFVETAGERMGYLPRETIVWVKGKEGMPITPTTKTGSDNNVYIRSACEWVLLFSKGRYYVDGGTGRRGMEDVPWMEETKNVWWIPAVSRSGHPCPWPAEIPRRLIDLFTCPRPERGFIPLVCDPFAGTGIAGVVARQMGRNFIGIEKNPEHAARARERIAAARPVFTAPVVSTARMSPGGSEVTVTSRLPVTAIVIDPTVNVRDGLDEATVEHYVVIFERLPPPVVYRLADGTHLLAAGFHRMEAARRLGLDTIEVEVREGTRRDAEVLAILDNAVHGRPYTRAERRRAIGRFLRLHPERADNWIAAELGVDGKTVRVVREEMEATSEIPKLERLVGRDGRERPRGVERAVGCWGPQSLSGRWPD